MNIDILLQSALMGFAIAAPVGPIGVLCIRRTLALGIPHGLASGLGAASADAIYGALLAFGLTAITSLLLDAEIVLNIVGGGLLLYIGVMTLRSTVSMPDSDAEDTSGRLALVGGYASTLALTITNPVTILVFLGIFAGFTETFSAEGSGPGWVVLGVFLGSAAWWLLLSVGVGLLRHRVTPSVLVWVNRVSGVVICGFAVRILLGALV
ncbi:MAG: LysE family transporter [Chloroflexota bacterium]